MRAWRSSASSRARTGLGTSRVVSAAGHLAQPQARAKPDALVREEIADLLPVEGRLAQDEESPRHAADAALAVGEDVEPRLDELLKELRAPPSAVEDNGHTLLAHEAADLVQDRRQHRDEALVGLGRHDEEGLPFSVIHPVVGRGGHGDAHPRDVRLRDRVLPVVDPNVSIHVEESHGAPPLRDASLCESAAEGGGAPGGRKTLELLAQRLHLRRAIESQDVPEVSRRALLQPLRPPNAEEGHQEQRHHGRPQAVKRGTEAAVDLPRHVEHPALQEGGEGQEDADTVHPRATPEERRGIVQSAHARQQPIHTSVVGIGIQREGHDVASYDDRSGQVWVRTPLRRRSASRARPWRSWWCSLRLWARTLRWSGQVWVRLHQGELLLFRWLLLPPEPTDDLTNGLLGHTEALRDLAIGQSLGLPLGDLARPRRVDSGSSFGVPAAAPDGREACFLCTQLVPTHCANVAAEGARDLCLQGPPLLHEAHHRIRLGGRVADHVVGERHPRDADHAIAAALMNAAALVDEDGAAILRGGTGEELPLRCLVFHARKGTSPAAQKADRFGSAPLQMGCAHGRRARSPGR